MYNPEPATDFAHRIKRVVDVTNSDVPMPYYLFRYHDLRIFFTCSIVEGCKGWARTS